MPGEQRADHAEREETEGRNDEGQRGAPEQGKSLREHGSRQHLGRTAARGALGGAVVGAALGGSAAVAKAVRPERVESVKDAVVQAGREVASAAAKAARDVLASKPVSDLLLAAKGPNGNRSEAMKQAAKEVGVAAAGAAREAIVSMREQSNKEADES